MLSNGKYVVLFNMFGLDGRLTGQQKMGEFSISNGAIVDSQGMCRTMIPIGPLTQSIELRVTHGLNNGYYEVRHEQSFRPRPLTKSETLTVSKGPFAKFLRAFESDLGKGLRNVTVDRRYWMPGLAGSNLGGTQTYIDSRLPEEFKGYKTDKYLLIHEVTEKWLMDKLGFDYGYAHNIALAAERYAVESDGLNWDEYEKHMWDFIHAYCMPHMVPKEKRPPDLDPDRVTHTRTIIFIIRHELRKADKPKAAKRFATIAVVHPETQNVLMGRRNDNGLYTMPGGHINKDESPIDGAKRELYEETGITAKDLKYLGSNQVKSPKGTDMLIYSFIYEKPIKETDTEQDPDNEVQEWEWISKDRMKKINHHVPLDKNTTLKILENRGNLLKKADKLNADPKDEQSEYAKMAEKIYRQKHDTSITSQDLSDHLDEMLDRRDFSGRVFSHINSTPEHVQKILDHPEFLQFGKDMFGRTTGVEHPDHKFHQMINSIAQSGDFSDQQINDLADKISEHPHHPTLWKFLYGLSKNPHISNHAAYKMLGVAEKILPRNVSGRVGDDIITDYAKQSLKNGNAPENVLERLSNSKYPEIRRLVAENHNTPKELIAKLLTDKNQHVTNAAKTKSTFHGIGNQSVVVQFGTNKARQVRDWIQAHGGTMHHKELAAAGLNLDSMKMSHLKGPKGYVNAEDVQKHIDSIPSKEYHFSESKYGFDPDEDYSDPANPQHKTYRDLERDEDGTVLGDMNPEDEQRHSMEPSKVFQLNVTPDHVQKMKQSGVWETFKKMNEKSVKSNHPAAPVHGLGWVRYTEKPDGVFIDEIQSDVGSSLVKKTRAHWNKKLSEGKATQDDVAHHIKLADEIYPEEHYNKINDIVFGGKDPSEVLHESFHQYLRDKGYTGKPVHIWGVKGKTKISLGNDSSEKGNIPAHMHRTYTQIPEKLGYTPAKYGELSTQNGYWQGHPDLHTAPEITHKTTLRKSEDMEYNEFIKLMKSLYEL